MNSILAKYAGVFVFLLNLQSRPTYWLYFGKLLNVLFAIFRTAIYLSMSVIFMAQLFKVPLSFSEMFSILVILMVTSKGAAGVTGSGFIVLASTLTAIHKIPLEGLAFLIGVDKFMSEARALTNVIGNGIACNL